METYYGLLHLSYISSKLNLNLNETLKNAFVLYTSFPPSYLNYIYCATKILVTGFTLPI